MSSIRSEAEAPAQQQPVTKANRDVAAVVKLFGIRAINYVTNHIIAHVPSYTARHLWYKKALGIQLGRGAGVHLGCYVWFYGPNDVRRTRVEIGENSHVNRDCVLDVRGGLRIGDNVSVSAEVSIVTIAKLATSRGPAERKPVVIEDNVWIGTRAIVMPGVTIGRGAIVGAGAVVIRDVPPLAVMFGSPARAVGKRPAEEAEYVLEGPFPLFE
jgi:acetyltransferase-like isoleucine patch superfamily enzyme